MSNIPPLKRVRTKSYKAQLLTEEQVKHIVERTLQSARPPMEKALGLSPRGYDRADAIAEGINAGLRRGLIELGLIEETH